MIESRKSYCKESRVQFFAHPVHVASVHSHVSHFLEVLPTKLSSDTKTYISSEVIQVVTATDYCASALNSCLTITILCIISVPYK